MKTERKHYLMTKMIRIIVSFLLSLVLVGCSDDDLTEFVINKEKQNNTSNRENNKADTVTNEITEVKTVESKNNTENIESSTDTESEEAGTTWEELGILPLEIKDSGWYVTSEHRLASYVVLYNPNEDVAFKDFSYRVKTYGKDGSVIGCEDPWVSYIHPKQEEVFGIGGYILREEPAKVEFTTNVPEPDQIKRKGEYQDYEPLLVSNTYYEDNYIKGELENPNPYEIEEAYITIVCRNAKGDIVLIDHSFAGPSVPPEGKVKFEAPAYNPEDEIDSFEVYAYQWMLNY